mgnify:CR=1 FL=1
MVARTCIATGAVLPAYRLIRFVAAPDGVAVADLAGRLPGRGAWVVAEASAIREAEKKGRFHRSLGVGLKSTEQDITLIAAGLRHRVVASAALARRAGLLLGGAGKLLSEGRVTGLFAADDASPRECKRLVKKLGVKWVSCHLTAREIGQICGRDSMAFAGLNDRGAAGAAKMAQKVHEEIMRLDGFYATAGCNDLPDRCIT